MRDLFESDQADNPVEALRRAVRPVRRRRFYKTVAIAAGENGHGESGYAVHQGEHIEPAKMPRTRLANTIIDGVAAARGQVAAEIRKYLASDLVFYRAEAPAPLRARQAQQWDPILAWARQALGADFKVGSGVVHVAQPAAAADAAGATIPDDATLEDDWRLGALHAATTLTGSALIALALMRGVTTAEAAWAAAHVDEDWNMEQWGRDEIALQRRAFRFAEFQAAAAVLRVLGK